jgi:hypothetical protein
MRRLLRHAPIAAAVAVTLGLVAGVTTSGAAFDTYRNEVMADGPAAYWRMGDSTSTLADETGANAGGYSGGFTLGTQGAVWNDANTAATFDGIKSSAAVADSPSLRMSTGVSVELWVRRKTTGNFQPLVGKPPNGQSKFENYSIWINSSNRPVAYFGNGTTYVSVTGPALDTSWHHVVATYNNATARIYVDGALSASTSSTVQLTPTADPVNIARSASGSYNSNVDLDEVAIYGSVLSASRISAHYGAARTDTLAPVVTLTSPADGSATTNRTPTISGAAGVLGGDSATVTVKVYAGTQATGTPVQTLTATRSAGGGWSVQPAALSDGTYTARAEQRDDAGNLGVSGTRTFTVDTVAPTASITQSPQDPSNSSSASVAFTANESGVTFACSVDSGAFASCTSPRSLTGLTDGSHTVRVRATDAAGNTGATASTTWRVDTVAPTVTITDGPPSLTESTDASVSFTTSETATTECSLDGAAFSSCTSPDAVSGLADGSHTLRVRATDTAGNTGPAASRTWTVDTTAPSPTLVNPPDGSTTNDDTPTLSGTAGRDANDQAHVTVQIYAGTSAGDTPLQTLTANRRSDGTYAVDAAQLAEGTYTAQTSQQDVLGHVGTSAPNTFTVDILTSDTTPPTVRLTAPAMNSSTQDTTPRFSGMAGTDPGDLDEITVYVYSGGSVTGTPLETLTTTRQADTSFTTDATSPLPDGSYTAQATQSDSFGNLGFSNTKTFFVDTVAPFASITSSPPAFSSTSSPSVAFTADEPNVTYVCSLDGSAFSPCTSPAIYSGVSDGAHTFQVHATDAAGNTGPDATASWTTDTVAPTASITDAPFDPTSATSASFSFAADEAGVTYACKLDAAGWASCDSPATYSGLADATHYFKVRATDQAGNVGPEASRSWTVDTTAPTVSLTAPANGSSSAWPRPTFTGVAGTAAGDASSVTVRLWTGTSTSGDPVDSLTATPAANGSYSVSVPSFRPPGTYTARADQTDGALNTGRSAATTFSITDPVMLAAGDNTSCETSDGDTATSQILLDHPDAIIAPLGDTAYSNGTPAEFANCYTPTWGRVIDRTYPAIGNHEYDTTNAQGYFDYFRNRLSPFGAAAGDPGRGWYSYDLGAWHVLVLNSNCTLVGGCDIGSPEEQWLKADLAAHPSECTLAMYHHPLFASDSVHGPNTEMRTFFRDLYTAGVDVVLNGHAHIYERFLPQTADAVADPNFGVQQFVVGTGGYFEYQFGTIQPNSAARTTNIYGVLKMSLHSHGWDWQFLPEAGRTFSDTGSGTCHGTPPPPPPGAPTVRSVSSSTANAATSMAITAPAGLQTGDLLLAAVSHQVAQFRNMTPPAGWTAVPNTDISEGNNVRIHAWYKLAGAAEPPSYTFTLSGGTGQDISGGILDLSGVNTSAPINASGGQSNGATPSKAVGAPSITTTVNNALDVFAGSCSASVSYIAPTGMVEQWDRTSSGTYKASTEVATAGQVTAGPAGVRSATASSACRSVGIQIAIAPAIP